MNSGVSALIAGPALTALITLLGSIFLAFSITLVVQLFRGRSRRAQASAASARLPDLQRALVQFLAGSPNDSVIREHVAKDKQAVAELLLKYQSTVSGGARDRLCHLALDLGFVREWVTEGGSASLAIRRRAISRLAFICHFEPCRRLAGDLLSTAVSDADEEVRLSAGRGLSQTGSSDDLEEVFLLALGPNPLTRAVLTEDLRQHAMQLCADTVPEVLRSGNPDAIRGALEIVRAWERAIPLEQLHSFLNHPDRDIRLLALQLAPHSTPDNESREAIKRAMEDADPEVRSLATAVAAHWNRPDPAGGNL